MRCKNRGGFFPPKHRFDLILIVMVMFVFIFLPWREAVWADDYTGLINLDAKMTVKTSRYYFDRKNQEIRFTAIITNTSSEAIYCPVVLAFSNIPQGVTLVSDGYLSSNTPCVDFTDMIPGGVKLDPGASTEVGQIAFHCPGRVRFTPQLAVWGQPALAVTATASPPSGPTPLAVAFSCQTVGEVVLYEWDFDGDGVYDWSSAASGSATHTYNSIGMFTATVRVANSYGSTATDSVVITTSQGLWAEITAVPVEGIRPLTVVFTPGGQSTGPSIIGYRWDFDGNGSWDTGWSARPDPRSYVYNVAGVYSATLQVRDEIDRLATASVDITVRNAPPTANVTVSPTNGPLPLYVTFSVSASSPNGAITSVVIDPADGSTPYALSGPGSVGHTYGTVGTYEAVVTVTDAASESLTIRSTLIDVRIGPPQSPTAVASASPTFGSAPLNVSFSAAGSSDVDGSLVLYEWDFDYAGVFAADWSSPSTGSASHSYSLAGEHIAALRVTDNDGMTAIDVVAVTVDMNVSLSVQDDTINAYNDETSLVSTTLSGASNVRVYIQSRSGVVVRNLFNGHRDPGTYEDSWDGCDDNGNIVPDADYYAFIDYQIGAVTHTKPDTASGGSFGFVSYTEDIQNGGSFNPWEDEFWELTFDTTRGSMGASEVTLWITPYYRGGVIVATPYSREVFGTGQYKCWWDGITDEGRYVTEADGGNEGDYLWSAQAWRLPDNAIVVEGGRPWITNPSANPNWFWPAAMLCLGYQDCGIQFHIDNTLLTGGNPLNATASASSSYSSSYSPAMMLDGNTSTYWYSGYGLPQWVQLDFPQSVSLDGIHIAHYSYYGRYSPDGVDITLSNGYSQHTAVNHADSIQIDIPHQTGIDWIRIQTTGSIYYNRWRILELQVNGEIEAPVSGDDLATVTLRVFNMENGNLLNSITTEMLPAGTHTIRWDGKTASGDEYVAPGSYRLELTAQSVNGDVSYLRRVLIKVRY